MSIATWLSVADIQERFAHLMGRDCVLALMRNQYIKSVRFNKSYGATEAEVDSFERTLLRTEKAIEFKDERGEVFLTYDPMQYTKKTSRRKAA